MQNLRIFVAEAVGTFALVFIGIGAIHVSNADLVTVAFAHGLAIAVFASATLSISGGHLNPAVTVGVALTGIIRWRDTLVYFAAQLSGAFFAALICRYIFDNATVIAGTPQLAEGIGAGKGVLIEVVLTFFLMFVIFGTAIDTNRPKIGGLAIGLAVTMDIFFGGPLTGAAMNPARTFGPALAANFWEGHWIYWLGPIMGALLATVIYKFLYLRGASEPAA